jgi:nitronate monooxygenase
MGSLPGAMLSPEALSAELTVLREQAVGPWNVNFFCHTPPPADEAAQARWRDTLSGFYQEADIDPKRIPAGPGRVPFSHAVADVVEPFAPSVVSFHFGLPAPDLLARVKGWGSWVIASATTVDEARWLQDHGADAVIAQGLEAGGHRGLFLSDDLATQLGTFALLPQVVAAVNVPVIAAGGIAEVVDGAQRAIRLLQPMRDASHDDALVVSLTYVLTAPEGRALHLLTSTVPISSQEPGDQRLRDLLAFGAWLASDAP